MRARIATTTAVLVLSALALTACDGGDNNDGDVNVSEGRRSPSASAPAGSASASPAPKGTDPGDSAKGGATATPAAEGSADGGSGTAACTSKNTEIRFVQAANRANEHEAAQGGIEVTNTSEATCTLVGAVTLTAEDDQGKADPVETDNSRGGTDAVEIAPGTTATSEVTYTNVNFEGSASGRDVCVVQASSVEIALPKDVARTVRVTRADGTAGSFDSCGGDVRIGAFHAS